MKKKYIVTWDMLQIYTRSMAKFLLPAERWKGIIAVSRGGLIPGALLARELDIRYVDTICVASYNYNFKHKLSILKKANVDGESFIIIDDLVDTGDTIRAIRNIYPKAYFVTIFAKPAGKSLVDNYIIDIPQNTWIEQPWDMGIVFIPPINKCK